MTGSIRRAVAASAVVLAAATIGTASASASVGAARPSFPVAITVPTGALGADAPLLTTGRAAQPPGSSAATAAPAASPLTLNEVMDNVRNWIIGLMSGLATVFVTIGGLRYLMAGGNEGEVMKAKGTLKSAAYGYGLAALAPVLVAALKAMVGAQ